MSDWTMMSEVILPVDETFRAAARVLSFALELLGLLILHIGFASHHSLIWNAWLIIR